MWRLNRSAVSSVLVTLAWAGAASAQAPQRPPTRGIVRLAGDLYRVQNDDHDTNIANVYATLRARPR